MISLTRALSSTFAVIALLLPLSGSAATPQPLKPCSATQLKDLQESLSDWQKQYPEYKSAMYLTQKSTGKVVGFFTWGNEDEAHAEVCEYIDADTDTAVANQWYYWESGKADPATWNKGKTCVIMQDEGIMTLKILKASKDSKIEAEMSIEGTDDKTYRRDTVVFSN